MARRGVILDLCKIGLSRRDFHDLRLEAKRIGRHAVPEKIGYRRLVGISSYDVFKLTGGRQR